MLYNIQISLIFEINVIFWRILHHWKVLSVYFHRKKRFFKITSVLWVIKVSSKHRNLYYITLEIIDFSKLSYFDELCTVGKLYQCILIWKKRFFKITPMHWIMKFFLKQYESNTRMDSACREHACFNLLTIFSC